MQYVSAWIETIRNLEANLETLRDKSKNAGSRSLSLAITQLETAIFHLKAHDGWEMTPPPCAPASEMPPSS